MTWNSLNTFFDNCLRISWGILNFVARCLTSNDPIAQLTKEFLFAVIIAAAASTVVKRAVDRSERKKRERLIRPIEEFIANALAVAHAEVREAILQIPELGKRRPRTRAGWLVQELSRIYASLSSSVIGAYSLFNDDQKAALAAYLGRLIWRDVGDPPDPERAITWVTELNAAFVKVKHYFSIEQSTLSAWTETQLFQLVELLDAEMRPKSLETPRAPTATSSEVSFGPVRQERAIG